MRKAMSLFIILSMILGSLVGCASTETSTRQTVSNTGDYYTEGIQDLKVLLANVSDENYDENKTMSFLEEYKEYNLNTSEKEFYGLIEEYHKTFLDWQDAYVNNKDSVKDLKSKELVKCYEDIENFINEQDTPNQ